MYGFGIRLSRRWVSLEYALDISLLTQLYLVHVHLSFVRFILFLSRVRKSRNPLSVFGISIIRCFYLKLGHSYIFPALFIGFVY